MKIFYEGIYFKVLVYELRCFFLLVFISNTIKITMIYHINLNHGIYHRNVYE